MTKLCYYSSTWHTCLYFLILLFPIYTFHVKRYGHHKSCLSLRSSSIMMMQQGSWPSTSLEEVTLYQLLQDKLLHHTSFSLPFSTTTSSTATTSATTTAAGAGATSASTISKTSTSSSSSSLSSVHKQSSSSGSEISPPFSPPSPSPSLFHLPQLSLQWSSSSTTATATSTTTTPSTTHSTSSTTPQSSDKLITFHFKVTKTSASPQLLPDSNSAATTTMKSPSIFSWPQTLPASPLSEITANLQEWSKHSTLISVPPDLSLPSLPVSLGWECKFLVLISSCI